MLKRRTTMIHIYESPVNIHHQPSPATPKTLFRFSRVIQIATPPATSHTTILHQLHHQLLHQLHHQLHHQPHHQLLHQLHHQPHHQLHHQPKQLLPPHAPGLEAAPALPDDIEQKSTAG